MSEPRRLEVGSRMEVVVRSGGTGGAVPYRFGAVFDGTVLEEEELQ